MVLLYMFFGAIILYFVIKYSVRDAIIEAEYNKKDLISNLEIEELLSEIIVKKNEVMMSHDSKEIKDKATTINDETLKVSSSTKSVGEKILLLESYRNEIISLGSKKEVGN